MILSTPLSVAHCALLFDLPVGGPHLNTRRFLSQNFLSLCSFLCLGHFFHLVSSDLVFATCLLYWLPIAA